MIMETNNRFERLSEPDPDELDGDLEDMFTSNEVKSSHTREFNDIAQKMFDALTSEKANELADNPPKAFEN